ncbi:Sof1-like protein [Corchorus olitorius]|uniref:Sof1-like protein n=1 Tax=Corchorus olitorius TaxID=93759 RepID=A0A1R3JAP0_9ROSI|nr:Sof1-like protein [Corchorus olitorius]
MEPMNFTAANEDCHCYSYDARKLDEAKCVHKDDVSAVVFCVKHSCDATYVISGSDDTNLSLWKAKASQQLGVVLPREKKKHEYLEAVKNRYKHLPQVKRIVRHRHSLPKPIYRAANLRRTMIEAETRKDHSAPGSIVTEPVRKRRIIKEVE